MIKITTRKSRFKLINWIISKIANVKFEIKDLVIIYNEEYPIKIDGNMKGVIEYNAFIKRSDIKNKHVLKYLKTVWKP